MSGIAEPIVVEPTRRRHRWTDGVLIGLRAAIVGTVVLLLAGALVGRGFDILADAGRGVLPSVVHWATGVSAALSYLLSHTLLYMVAGIVILALVGLPDRLPPLITGLVLGAVLIEFGFFMLTTESHALGRVDATTWRALLIAHAAGDLVFLFGIVRAHPSVRQALVRGYEW
jgi:hypothetical protein